MTSDSLIHYSIVVPFFNEQENIPPLYMKLTEVLDAIGEPYELVFVDDGSKDNTFKVLSDIYEHDRRVNVVRLRRNFGQTPALKAGFDFARGEVIISMDGDLQHDPEEIPRFLEKIEEGYDLVSGWRHNRRDHWLMRPLPSPAPNWRAGKFDRRENCGSAHRESPAEKRKVQLRDRSHHPRISGFDYRQIFIGLFDAAAPVFRLAGRGRGGAWLSPGVIPGLRKILP